MFDPKVDAYMAGAVDAMPIGKVNVREALKAIADQQALLVKRSMTAQPYQLLALRRYLRAGGAKLLANWPWTVLEQSTTYSQVITALKQAAIVTKANFERSNPGYVLGYTGARSLERQAVLWIDNDTVVQAALKLMNSARTELATATYLAAPTEASAKQFSKFLSDYAFSKKEEPSNAAPGLSDHGQMKAVDFYIDQHGKRVADIRTALIDSQWVSTGFAQKLKAATVGTNLEGPLKTPYEPWHYSIPF